MKLLNRKSSAQSLVEYALILALVTVIAIAALQFLGKQVNTAVEGVGNDVVNGTSNAAQAYCEGLGNNYKFTNGRCERSTGN